MSKKVTDDKTEETKGPTLKIVEQEPTQESPPKKRSSSLFASSMLDFCDDLDKGINIILKS